MSRTMSAVALAVAALAHSAEAAAKAPVAQLPDARVLRAHGVRVTWPLPGVSASLAAGTVLRVKVRPVSPRRRAKVRLALVRTTAAGRPLRTLFAVRIRRGTFSAVVPGPVGATHHLTLTAGRRVYRSVITTAATPTAAPAPAGPVAASDYVSAVPPMPGGSYIDPPPALPPCAPAGAASAALRVTPAQVAPGGILAYEVTNTGQRCLVPTLAARIERFDGDAWVFTGMSSLLVGGQPYVWAGGLYSGSVTLRPDAQPGRHRLTMVFGVRQSEPDTLEASAEFDVVAP